MKNILIIFITFLSFSLNAQTSEMEYNRNFIPWDFVPSTEKIIELQDHKHPENDIILILEKTIDTLHSEFVFYDTDKLEKSLYSIYVFNNTKDSLIIERQDRSFYLIQEAKNKIGEWKPIEYWRYSTCGNSYLSDKLKPNGIMKTVSIAYNGDFETQIRFKLLSFNKVYYSNPINGFVKLSQFTIPENINESRNYKQVATVGDNELLNKLLFLEPNGLKEFAKKQEEYLEKMAELRKKNGN